MRVARRTIAGRQYAVAVFAAGEPLPDPAALAELNFDGVRLPAIDADSRRWLAAISRERVIRCLEVDGAWRGSPPDAELGPGLEVIELLGAKDVHLDVRDFPKLRVMTVAGALSLTGHLSDWLELNQLALGHYIGTGLEELSGCISLESVKLTGRHQEVTPNWAEPPSSLRHFFAANLYLTGLDALGELERLMTLSVDVPRPRRSLPVVSLAPLERCLMLEWLELWRAAELRDIEVLGRLPHIQNVVVEEGRYGASDLRGLPVTVVRERKRPF